jgi:hypothetical protein
MPESFVAIFSDETKRNHTLEKIRYIAGCPSLNPKWQDENGYKPNLEVDNIYIVNGTETFLREGNDAVKYDYIRLYQGNVNNPHRPPNAGDEFQEIVEREIAEAESVDFETEVEAMNLIKALRKKKEGGGYTYNTERLELFTRLFALDDKDSEVEKFSQLAALVKDAPEVVVKSIANHKKGVFGAVKQAETLSVLIIDDEKAAFSNKTVLLPFKSKMSKTNQLNALVDFLITKTGSDFYREMLVQIDDAQTKLLGEQE